MANYKWKMANCGMNCPAGMICAWRRMISCKLQVKETLRGMEEFILNSMIRPQQAKN